MAHRLKSTITVPPAASFPLEEVGDAFRLSQSGQVRRKIAVQASR